MTRPDRRALLGALAGLAFLPARARGDSAAEIDADVDEALRVLRRTIDGAEELEAQARGVLVMPSVIKGGLIIGGSYGEGALRLNGRTVDYYSVAAASVGYQIGVQETAHALFFMTQPALERFRRSSGWELGVDAEFTVPGDGISLNLDTTSAAKPVIAIVFAQDGLLAGASLAGAKYTRIRR